MDDNISLSYAAFSSRFDPFALMADEEAMFEEFFSERKPEHIQLYLYIRNRILQLWHLNSVVQLTYAACADSLQIPENCPTILPKRIFEFLTVRGSINVGVFKIIKPYPILNKHVIVIGAGIAGLIAARQLQYFGIDVTVIEGRKRVGGRIATYRNGDFVADLGAIFTPGLGGNPLATLFRQIPVELQELKSHCPLFDYDGKPVTKEMDESIETEVEDLLKACRLFGMQLDAEKLNGAKLSLGQTIDAYVQLQETLVRERHLESWKALLSMQERLNVLRLKLKGLRTYLVDLRRLVDQFDDTKLPEDPSVAANYVFNHRSNCRTLDIMCDKYVEYTKILCEKENEMVRLEKEIFSGVYMSQSDRRCLDWHMANLEFSKGAPLSKLSLQHWDHGDEGKFTGQHISIKNGFSTIVTHLADGVNVRCGARVKEIRYSDADVGVTIQENDAADSDLRADAILCTIPLGVLKKSLDDGESEEANKVRFTPPLPDSKIDAIKRLGYGNLNKVVLFFDHIFWDPRQHLFGYINMTQSSRGEMFLFWSIYSTPVLIASIAGEAADLLEPYSDEQLVNRCMAILRTIFGSSVPSPKDHVVTRWGQDKWSEGAFSYIGVNATRKDYDELAEPVKTVTQETPKLYFAGEHTCSRYPATVHGAMLSGLREAARLEALFRP